MAGLASHLTLRPMPVPTRHKFSARLVPSRRQKPFVRAAYASGAGEDPYKVCSGVARALLWVGALVA